MLQIVLGFNQAWLVPIQIAVIIFLLAETIGVAAVAGLAVMLVMLPLMAIVRVLATRFPRCMWKGVPCCADIVNALCCGCACVPGWPRCSWWC